LGAERDSVFPQDVLDHPDWYGAQHQSTIELVRRCVGRPDTTIHIYRAVPPGIRTINPGDWVAISYEYALSHSYGLMDGTIDDGSTDGDIIHATTTADSLFSEGYLEEWGYWGTESLTAEKV